MAFHRPYRVILIGLLSLACVSCGGGMSDPKGLSQPQGSDVFETNLVRIADLDASGRVAFSNIGSDPLAAGKVEVKEEEPSEVKFEAKGAMPSRTYGVEFCSFATGTGGCFAIGSFTTGSNGEAEVQLPFPQHGVFAGVFVLTRDGQSQFVSGFTVPVDSLSNAKDEGEEQQTEGFEVDLQRVSTVNGELGANFGSSGADPLGSGRVEVEDENESSGKEENENEGPVEVKVVGAAATATYGVEFCRFGVGPGGCVAVGSFTTDMQGNAEVDFAFPLAGTFDGIFVLTRNVDGQVQNEFVTGFAR